MPAAQRGRGVAAQVALARRESHHRGQRHLGLATIVATELPHTWAAWRDGRITEWKATLVARETACLTREDRAAVDAAVASDPDRLEAMGDRELAVACQKEAYRLDPESYVTRRRHAEADRQVTLRPAPDAMAWLTALVPVKDGVAVKAALSRRAASAQAAGDPTLAGTGGGGHLVDSVLAALASSDDDVTRWNAQEADGEPKTPRAIVPVALGLVMTDQALFGGSDEPACIEGYGPSPPSWPARSSPVRARARSDLGSGGSTPALPPASWSAWTPCPGGSATPGPLHPAPRPDLPHPVVRRADPARRPRRGVRRRRLNQRGERPGPLRGVQPRQAGAGLASQTLARPGAHEIETTTPTGHAYRSRAPAVVATIRETPIRLDLVLAS